MSNVNNELQSAVEEVGKLYEAYQEAIKKFTEEKIAKLFSQFVKENSDKIYAIKWSQYTPYFNDGEPCTFSVNDLEFILVNPEGEYNDDELMYEEGVTFWSRDFEGFKKYNSEEAEFIGEEAYNRMSDFSAIFNKLEDILEGAFGDHSLVFIKADGYVVEEYEHD